MDNEQWRAVRVPVAVIRDGGIPLPARCMYMVILAAAAARAKECRISEQSLADLGGFGSRHTVRRYLRLLASAGLVAITPGHGRGPSRFAWDTMPKSETVLVPLNVLHDRRLNPAAKTLYAFLLALRQPDSPLIMRQPELAAALGLKSTKVLRSAVAQLRAGGWLRTELARSRAGMAYELLDPYLALRSAKAERIQELIVRTNPKGEFIMKKMLDELVSDEVFQDSARPGFLRNPLTGERMEFDRWYTEARVAIEFQGIQHYRATKDISEQQVRKQQARDLMKQGLAAKKSIQVVLVHGRDLTFSRLGALLQDLVPLRELRTEDPVVQMLAGEGQRYAGD